MTLHNTVRTTGPGVRADEDIPPCPSSAGLVAIPCKPRFPNGHHHSLLPVPFWPAAQGFPHKLWESKYPQASEILKSKVYAVNPNTTPG